jgi:uncharacterized membrane protein
VKDKKFIGIHLLFVAYVAIAFALSLIFQHGISFQHGWGISRVPTSMSWNIFLALISYDAAHFLVITKQKILKILLGIVWFFFYPNTFYMLLDATHIADWISKNDWIPMPTGISDQRLFYFYLILVAIIFGVLLGIFSILKIMSQFSTGKIKQGSFLVIMSFLSSIAIFAGKALSTRLNSWYIITNPLETIKILLNTIQDSHMSFLISTTIVQIFLILLLKMFLNDKEKDKK